MITVTTQPPPPETHPYKRAAICDVFPRTKSVTPSEYPGLNSERYDSDRKYQATVDRWWDAECSRLAKLGPVRWEVRFSRGIDLLPGEAAWVATLPKEIQEQVRKDLEHESDSSYSAINHRSEPSDSRRGGMH